MWLLLLLRYCKKLTKLSRKLFINNPDLKKLYTTGTLIVTPPEATRRQGCDSIDPDNVEAIKRYLDELEADAAAGQETLSTEVKVIFMGHAMEGKTSLNVRLSKGADAELAAEELARWGGYGGGEGARRESDGPRRREDAPRAARRTRCCERRAAACSSSARRSRATTRRRSTARAATSARPSAPLAQ